MSTTTQAPRSNRVLNGLDAIRAIVSRRPKPRPTASVAHAVALATACLISYWLTTRVLSRVHSLSASDDLVGSLWAVIATIFVYREEHRESISAALTRASATALSFALCVMYLLFFSFHPLGLAAVVGAETFLLGATGRDGDIGVCNVTTAVVMIAAALSPRAAWQEPILRLVDTAIGIVIGVGASSMAFCITALRAHHRAAGLR